MADFYMRIEIILAREGAFAFFTAEILVSDTML